jgi:hypothetical protein
MKGLSHALTVYDVRTYADVVQNKHEDFYNRVKALVREVNRLSGASPYWICNRLHNLQKVAVILRTATWTLHVSRTPIPRAVTQVAWTHFYYTLRAKLAYFRDNSARLEGKRCTCSQLTSVCASVVPADWAAQLQHLTNVYAKPAHAHMTVYMHVHAQLGNDLARTIFSYL